MKFCWKCIHSQAIQDVDEFVSSLDQIQRNVVLHHLSPVDALEWMGAVRLRVQTADKNTTIIHTVQYVFVRNTSIINAF